MIKEVIVVEGKNDTRRLKLFFDADTIETGGLNLNEETIAYIKEVNSKRGVILFLDPDHPGEKIRKRLNDAIPGLKNAFIMKEDGRTKKKVGIEHASREVLEEALKNLLTCDEERNTLSKEEFVSLGLDGQEGSAERREKISRHFHLGKCNAKTMHKRLNMLGLTYDEIMKVL